MAINWGRALGGFGAAMQGNTAQFNEDQRRSQAHQMMMQQQQAQGQQQADARNQAQLQQRAQVAYQHAQVALDLAKKGDFAGVVDLATNRRKFNGQLGIQNNEETDLVMDTAALAATGDEKAKQMLIKNLTGMVNFGRAHFGEGQGRRDAVSTPGKIAQDQSEGWLTAEQAGAMSKKGIDPAKVKSSKILDDGTIVTVLDNNTSTVLAPDGSELSGDARSDAIKDANQYGIDIQTKRAGGRAGATQSAGRDADMIERGITAAESTSGLRRGIELLDMVETGGWSSVGQKIRTQLGIQGANDAELTASLGNAVMSQLKDALGASFTERDREAFENMNANIGTSTEGNKRILKQSLKLMEKTAKRAIRKSRRLGFDDEADDMEEMLKFSLSLNNATAQPSQSQVAPQGSSTRLEELKRMRAQAIAAQNAGAQ